MRRWYPLLITTAILPLIGFVGEYSVHRAQRNRNEQCLKAAGRGDAVAVRSYLAQGVDKNTLRLALYTAVVEGHSESVQVILNNGANPNEMVNYVTDRGNRPDILAMLMEAGGHVSQEKSACALCYAAREADIATVERLLRLGVDVNQCPNDWRFSHRTPLLEATNIRSLKTFQVLVAHHADLNAKDEEGNTALMAAVGTGGKDGIPMSQYLLQHGADVNVQDMAGRTALMKCIMIRRSGRLMVMDMLLRHGADPNAQDEYMDSPLKLAQKYGDQEIIARLKQAGARL